MSGWSGQRVLAHPVDPRFDTRVAVDRQPALQDPVELLLVALFPEHRVLEERERDDVGGAEVAEQVVAPREERLEEIEGRGDARSAVLLVPARSDQVRRPLPEAVEPVDEYVHLRATRLVRRPERPR